MMMRMKVGIYARVSTTMQEIENQLLQLREYCQRNGYEIFAEYIDEGISGAKRKRPQLNRMMDDIFDRKFDILLVWDLSRLARSLKQLLDILEKLNEKKIDFICYTQKIDTTTPTGKLMFQIIGAFAEFERNMISERVKAGMERAMKNGVKVGRPKIEDESKMSRVTLWRRKRMFQKPPKNTTRKNTLNPQI